MHARTERRENADPPVADLVGEPFDDDRAVVRHGAGGVGLVGEVGEEIGRGAVVEAIPVGQRVRRENRIEGADLSDRRPQGSSELDGPTRTVTVPERHAARFTRRGSHNDSIAGDLGDTPRRRAEQEGLADAALVDHLLVELADTSAVGEEHSEQAAVGDRPRVGDREPLGAVARPYPTRGAIPHDPWLESGELIRWIPAGEQVEDAVEGDVGKLGVVGRAADERGHLVDIPVVHGGHGDHLLGEHVEWIGRERRLFDEAVVHEANHNRGLEQIPPVFREDRSSARLADPVAGPTDPLNASGRGPRGLHLYDEVDGAHVDPELE